MIADGVNFNYSGGLWPPFVFLSDIQYGPDGRQLFATGSIRRDEAKRNESPCDCYSQEWCA